MIKDDDVNTCLKIGSIGVNILTALILALCLAIVLWA